MKNFIRCGAAASFLAVAAASPAYASMVGDTLGCTSTPLGFFDCSVGSFTVGAGPELTLDLTNLPFFQVDFSATTIQFTYLNPFNSPTFGLGAGETVTFTGFDNAITGVGLATSGITGLTLSDLSFTGSSLSIDVDSGAMYTPGASFTVTVNSAQVPAPASLPLVGLALAALALARRRKS